MPIPSDPLNRWWMDVAAVNPSRVDALRPALLAFMAFGPEREASLAGSGFVIAGNSDFALAITAKHVLTEGISRSQRPWSSHVPSAVCVPSGAYHPSLDPQKLKAVWMGSEHADMMNVAHVGFNHTLDIACCIVIPQEHAHLFRPVSLPMDTAVPGVGDLVHMVSLDNMVVEERVAPADTSGTGQLLSISRRVNIRVGIVTGVYPQGLRHYRWPCFTTSIPGRAGNERRVDRSAARWKADWRMRDRMR